MYCKACGSEMQGDATFCSKCEAVPGVAMPPNYQPMVFQKSVAIAAILALIIPGVGHIYVGKVKQGILFLATIFGFFIFMTMGMFILVIGFGSSMPMSGVTIMIWLVDIFLLGVWIYQIWDAVRSAKEYNRLSQRDSRPPW